MSADPSGAPETKGRGPSPAIEPVKGTAVGSVFVSNYPPFSAWDRDHITAFEQALDTPWNEASPPLGLYMHIPFCRKRCKFCYFRVYTDRNAEQIQTYLEALAHEIELYGEKAAFAGRPLDFVYFGGGTPSYIAVKHLEALVARIQRVFAWNTVKEITFECEPGTLTEAKVAAIRGIGVTRLSLGVEHFDDRVLRTNGRAHESKEIDRCLPWIRAAGFAQLNIDLIAGMVGECWETWRQTVARTVEVDPDSVTIYQMELPYNTVYSKDILDGGRSPVADWQTKRAMHDYAVETLSAAGYVVSSAYTLVKKRALDGDGDGNFRYRDALWHGADLLGTGVASFGHLSGVHFQNQADWDGYLAPLARGALSIGRAFRTDKAERLTRELILQLKLGRVDARYFAQKFAVDVLDRYGQTFAALANAGMLEIDAPEVRLTRQGLLQVDHLLPSFYAERYRTSRYT